MSVWVCKVPVSNPGQALCGSPIYGLPRLLSGEESSCSTGDTGLIPWVGKNPLEKEMAVHSSILAWEILWTEEPDGLQFMGL